MSAVESSIIPGDETLQESYERSIDDIEFALKLSERDSPLWHALQQELLQRRSQLDGGISLKIVPTDDAPRSELEEVMSEVEQLQKSLDDLQAEYAEAENRAHRCNVIVRIRNTQAMLSARQERLKLLIFKKQNLVETLDS